MSPPHNDNTCCQNEKIVTLEKEVTNLKTENAKLNARLDNKKDDIYSINKELIHDRETQIKLLTEVTELKTLLKDSQEERKGYDEEIKSLKGEINELKLSFIDFKSGINSFRNTMLTIFGVGTPIVSIAITVLLKLWGI